MKLFSTSSLSIPIMLKTIIKNVIPKIIILLFLVKEPSAEVIRDFSVSLRAISFSDESKLIKEGSKKNVTSNETIRPIMKNL